MKLEDKIKEQLESRRLEPTASAWERIEGKLDTQQKKQKSKVVLWMAIAASFVAGMFITALLFSDSDSTFQNEIVVSPDIDKTKTSEMSKDSGKQQEIDRIVNQKDKTLEVVDKTLLSRKRLKTNSSESNTMDIKPSYSKTTSNSTSNIVENTENQSTLESQEINQAPQDVKTKIQEVLATVDVETITDMEVDSLLKNAQREIISERAFGSNSNRVDANALLLDAEAEVDPDTFKDKIFRTLKKELNRAVDAVVNKDN